MLCEWICVPRVPRLSVYKGSEAVVSENDSQRRLVQEDEKDETM